jgi:hypothetical protein
MWLSGGHRVEGRWSRRAGTNHSRALSQDALKLLVQMRRQRFSGKLWWLMVSSKVSCRKLGVRGQAQGAQLLHHLESLDRHGNCRWRFRRGGKTVQLPGKPGIRSSRSPMVPRSPVTQLAEGRLSLLKNLSDVGISTHGKSRPTS